MSILGLLFGDNIASTYIAQPASIELDVLLDETHEWSSDVTTNEVEDGVRITDHIRLLPDRLTFTGMISNTNLSGSFVNIILGQISAFIDGAGGVDRMQTSFDLLRAMHEARTPVTVYTKWRVYENMALTSCSIPRNASIGQSAQFTLSFTEIRIVSTQTVEVPPGISAKKDAKEGGKTGDTAKKTSPQKDAGKVQSKTKDAYAPQNQSVLKGVLS